MLGKRKGNVPEDINPASVQQESISEARTASVQPQSQTAPLNNQMLAAKIEKLDLELKAFNELRKVYDQRFFQLTEKIGELRSNLIEKEKEIREMAAQSERAYDVVKSVKPENLLAEVKKEDARIETISAKLDATQQIVEQMMNEMKDFRKEMLKFKGLDEAMEISRELMKEVSDIRKLSSRIEIDADKVEKIFLDMQRKFAHIENIEDTTKNAIEAVTDISKQVNELKVKSSNFVTREELKKMSDAIDSKLSFLSGFSESDKNMIREFMEEKENLKSRIESLEKQMKGIKGLDSLEEMEEWMDKEKSLASRLDNLENEIKRIKDVLESREKKEGIFSRILGKKEAKEPLHHNIQPEPGMPENAAVTGEAGPAAPHQEPLPREDVAEASERRTGTKRRTRKGTRRTGMGALENAISSGDIKKAVKEYKRLYRKYEDMPAGPEADKLYKNLQTAYKRIQSLAKGK